MPYSPLNSRDDQRELRTVVSRVPDWPRIVPTSPGASLCCTQSTSVRQPSQMVVQKPGPWDESPGWATNPMSPSKREAYRMERCTDKPFKQADLDKRFSMYQTRQARTASMAPVLDESLKFKDTRVQALVSLAGELPTAMGQRPDRSIANNNTLRYVRQSAALGLHMASDGGPLYSTTTLENNWVEDRRDKHHTSDWHVKELRRNKLWDTEHTANFGMHNPEYADKVLRRSLVASVAPSIQVANKLGPSSSVHLVHYGQDGFGDTVHQDHTSISKRGGHWLGIAPVHKESVTTTVHGHREYLEFQKRTPTTDAKAKFLGTEPGGRTTAATDPWRTKAHDDLALSQRHTVLWNSTYVRDFQDRNNLQRGAPRCWTALQSQRPTHQAQRPVTSGVA